MSKEGGFGVQGLTTGVPWVVGLVAVAALVTRAPAPAMAPSPVAADTARVAAAAELPGRALGAVVPIAKLITDVANERLTPPDVVQSWEVLEAHLRRSGAENTTAGAIDRLRNLVYGGQAAPIDDDGALALLAGFESPARGDVETHRKRLLEYFRATRAPADYVRRAQEAVNRVADVEFVIATVPDYVDSYSRWIADEALGSIQAAAGASDYVLDRFHLPGWPSLGREAEGRTRRVHEFEPGALIFRAKRTVRDEQGVLEKPEKRARLKLLVVLIVAETATRGLEKPSFAAAAQLALAWNPKREPVLKVLGPHFSGTSQSLRLAIEQAFRDRGQRESSGALRVQVVTGSATSDANKAIIEGEPPYATQTAREVVFASAVHTDPEMLGAIERRLDAMGIPPSQVALLVEENTAWGAGLFEKPTRPGGKSCQNPEKGRFSCAIRMSFPMHVSRLASVTERAKRAATPVPVAATPSLELVDVKEPADSLPTFTPALTEGTMATALASVLSTLVREQIRAVGILATDKRDFVFLAREVIRAAPNVQLFTTEPHILFLHPDYRSFVRGTLVASSYPLFARTQPPPLRRQFSTMAAQGRYNALVYLLEKNESLVDAFAADVAPEDLSSRLKPAALWLGLVGQDRFVPLEAVGKDKPPLTQPYLNLGRTWAALRITLLLTLLAHLALIIAARSGRTPLLRSFFAPFRPVPDAAIGREQRMLTAAAVTSIALLAVWLLMLGMAITEDRDVGGRFVSTPLLLVTAAVGAVAALQLVVHGIRRAIEVRHAAHKQPLGIRQPVLGTVVVLVAVSVLGAATYAFVTAFVVNGPVVRYTLARVLGTTATTATFDLVDLQLAAERILDLQGFVSPSAMVLAFGVIGYTWAVWSLRCLRHQTYRFEATAPLVLTLTRNDRRLAADLSGALSTTMHQSGRYFLLPLAALVLVLPGMVQTYSVDGKAFAYAAVFGSGLAMLACTVEAAQAAWLGWTLKAVLERVRLHPIAEEIAARGKDPLDWGINIEPKFGTARRLLRDRLTEVRRHLNRVPHEVVQPARPPEPVLAYNGPEQRREATTNLNAPEMAVLPPAIAEFARRAKLRAQDLGWVENWDHRAPDPDAHDARQDDEATGAEATRPLFCTELWRSAVTGSNQLAAGLWRGYWSEGRRPGTLTPADEYFRSAERFVSLMAALVLRAVVARVVRGLSLALLLGGVLFLGHLLYTFPGRQFWLMVDLVGLSAVAAVGVYLLVALERDEILSGLWSTKPGKVGLGSGLVLRIVAYAALPLLTVFASQFPEAAGGLTSWLEPVRQMLPR